MKNSTTYTTTTEEAKKLALHDVPDATETSFCAEDDEDVAFIMTPAAKRRAVLQQMALKAANNASQSVARTANVAGE